MKKLRPVEETSLTAFDGDVAVAQRHAEQIATAKEDGRHIEIVDGPIESIRAQIHEMPVAGFAYQGLIRDIGDPIILRTSIDYAGDLLQRMKARDDMERMLIEHALWTHGRLFKLNVMLAKTDRVNDLRILSDLIDRASNDFRKAFLALAEYRRPARSRKTTIVRQLNAAHQQIVNGGNGDAKPIGNRRQRTLAPAPNQSRRSSGVTRRRKTTSALAKVDRPAHGRR